MEQLGINSGWAEVLPKVGGASSLWAHMLCYMCCVSMMSADP